MFIKHKKKKENAIYMHLGETILRNRFYTADNEPL